MSEAPFTFLLVLGVGLWNLQRGLLSGVAFGLGALTRPIMLPFVVLIALSALLFKFSRGTHTKIAIAALLTIAPWTIRNAVTFGSFIPIQSQGWGANLLFGTVDVPYGAGNNIWFAFGADKAAREIIESEPTEIGAEKKMLLAAVARINADPFRWFWLRVEQYPRLFADTGTYLFKLIPIPPEALKVITLFLGFCLFILSFFGALSVRRALKDYYALAAFPIFMLIIQFPAYGEIRFLVPTLPLLSIFAAICLSRLLYIRANSLSG
jgi:hypothetical protein